MAWLVIDELSDPAQWIALAPDGVTPSTELTLNAPSTPGDNPAAVFGLRTATTAI